MGKKVKLLVCYHKKDILFKDDILTPIHVGRSLARKKLGEDDLQFKWMLENMIGDDTGENISEKNASYNELTAIYWAWKNYEKLDNPDYIGLMHYRRHFIFRPSTDVVESVNAIDENYFKRINYNKQTIEHLFDDCDYVAHIGRVDEVYKHYKENHHIEDLELAIGILKEKYPEFSATAEEYLKMSYVNLCNMFIMPRKMFFEYCSWLFGILEEFEKNVDLSDKRLFISERLTGIFIEHCKRKGLNQKALSATFIQSETRIPVVMPYNYDTFRTAVTIASILKQAEKTTFVDFYIFHSGNAKGNELKELIELHPGNTLTYIDVVEWLNNKKVLQHQFSFPEHYPLVAAEILEKINKFLYLDERAFFFGDITKFYLACNNDEFAVLGLPDISKSKGEKIDGSAFSINASRLRRLHLMDTVKDLCGDMTSAQVFSQHAAGQVNGFPWWIYNVTNEEKDGRIYYDRHRGDQRWAVWERALLYYGKGVEPWKNIQALFSVYWWEVAAELPSSIPFVHIDENAFDLFYAQSVSLCEARGAKKVQGENQILIEQSLPQEPFKQPKENILKRSVRYYKENGFKKTLNKVLNKLFRR